MVYSGTTEITANFQLVVCKGKGFASIEWNSEFSGTGSEMIGTEDSAEVLMFKEDKDREEGLQYLIVKFLIWKQSLVAQCKTCL